MKRRQWTTAALAAAMLAALAGCAGPAASGAQSSSASTAEAAAEATPAETATGATPDTATAESAAPGAWQEQAIEPPDAVLVSGPLCEPDGTVRLFLWDTDTEALCMMISRDNGATWGEEAPPDWLAGVPLAEGWRYSHIAIAPDGGWKLVWTLWEGTIPEANQGEQWLVDPEGNATQLDFDALAKGATWAACTVFLDNQTLALMPMNNQLPDDAGPLEPFEWNMLALDLTSGRTRTLRDTRDDVLSYYEEVPRGSGNWVYHEGGINNEAGVAGKLAYTSAHMGTIQLRVVDPETGLNEVWLDGIPGGEPSGLCAGESGSLYYLTAAGIYRLAAGGTLPELILGEDGTHIRALTAPDEDMPVTTCRIRMACAADGSLLAVPTLPTHGARTMYRYVWGEGV